MRKIIILGLIIIFTILTGIGLFFIHIGSWLDFITFLILQIIIIFYLFYYGWPNIKTTKGYVRFLNILGFYVISIFAFLNYVGIKFF